MLPGAAHSGALFRTGRDGWAPGIGSNEASIHFATEKRRNTLRYSALLADDEADQVDIKRTALAEIFHVQHRWRRVTVEGGL